MGRRGFIRLRLPGLRFEQLRQATASNQDDKQRWYANYNQADQQHKQ